MLTPPILLRALMLGVSLGVAFDPLASLVSAIAVGALYGSPRAPQARRGWAAAVVVLAWLIGDGFRVMARLRDALDGVPLLGGRAPLWATLELLAVWAATGLLVGYVVPAVVAVVVGHGVVRGTGWLSAMAAGATTSLVLSTLAPPASGLLVRLSGG